MSYAVVVARAAVEDRTTELHVLAVHQGLELADAMRLLGQRPPGTVGHLRRLPADLPEVGEVLRLEAGPPMAGDGHLDRPPPRAAAARARGPAMRRCGCTACLLADALVLLRSGRAGMATLLVEQALEQAEQQKAKRVAPPARRGRGARP
jgi:hypothetical protein